MFVGGLQWRSNSTCIVCNKVVILLAFYLVLVVLNLAGFLQAESSRFSLVASLVHLPISLLLMYVTIVLLCVVPFSLCDRVPLPPEAVVTLSFLIYI